MKKFLFLVGLLGMLGSCQNEEENPYEPKERKDIVMSRSEEQMTEECTEFAFRFFKQINQTEVKEPNWMVSPLSASLALGMITNGAGGNTLDEMKNTLGFSSSSLDEMNAYYQKLTRELLNLDNSTRVGIANSIWISDEFDVYNSFVDVNKSMYNAKVSNLDFSSAKAPGVINRWCSDQTNGCIEKVVSEIPKGARLYLLNALYFKGIWKEKFKESNTKLEYFYNADGSKSHVDMMHQSEKFMYSYDDIFCMAEFPYGNEAFSMVIVLPDEGKNLDDVLDKLTYDYWKELNQNACEQELGVALPRFEIKYKKNLNDDMKAMGMKDAFDDSKADFSAISSSPLYLSLLNQSTYIKVDEEGTKAAAVTLGGLWAGAPGPSSSILPFWVNRPFAYLIKEKSTGTILFMGKVTKL